MKMNLSLKPIKTYFESWKNKDLFNSNVKTIFCPSYTELFVTSSYLSKTSCELGAQNVYFEDKGAFTGEISATMLKEIGCKWVIIGHSERRDFLKETDKVISKKINKLFANDLRPILCIGENLSERKSCLTNQVLESQIKNTFKGMDINRIRNKFLVAYEPVWAIGTGLSATREQIKDAHTFIENILLNIGFNRKLFSILYGGSVSEKNIKSLSELKVVDGFLVGTASLNVDSFYLLYKTL